MRKGLLVTHVHHIIIISPFCDGDTDWREGEEGRGAVTEILPGGGVGGKFGV